MIRLAREDSTDTSVVDQGTQRQSVLQAPDIEAQIRNDLDGFLVALHTQYRRMVFVQCLRTLRNVADAEDATQEAFIKMRRYLLTYDPRQLPLEGWVCMITRNIINDSLRSRYRTSNNQVGLDDAGLAVNVSVEPTQFDELLFSELRSLLIRFIESLPFNRRRVALSLLYAQGEDQGELAGALGINKSTFRQHVFIMRQDVRRWCEINRMQA